MKKIVNIIKEELEDIYSIPPDELENMYKKELGYIPDRLSDDALNILWRETNQKRNQKMAELVMADRRKWESMQRDDLRNIPKAIEKGWTLELEGSDRDSILLNRIPANAVGFNKGNKNAQKRYSRREPDSEKGEKFGHLDETWKLFVDGKLTKEYNTLEELLNKES